MAGVAARVRVFRNQWGCHDELASTCVTKIKSRGQHEAISPLRCAFYIKRNAAPLLKSDLFKSWTAHIESSPRGPKIANRDTFISAMARGKYRRLPHDRGGSEGRIGDGEEMARIGGAVMISGR